MMKNIIVLIFSFLAIVTHAQQQACGTYTSPEDMQAFYNRERAPEYNLRAGDFVEVPMVYHITRRDDGTGGFDLAETFRLHCDLNEKFEDAEIHFYILDIVEHNNTGYFNMDFNGAGNAMMNNENDLNACNVFIVNEAKSGSTTVCGYSFLASGWGGPNRGGVVLGINCSAAGSTTLTHEMGHYLNLPHTFYGWEGSNYITSPIPSGQWERSDGSNCTFIGDGFCDTPPDYISDRWACNTLISYNDAVGDNFTVDEKNYMSYSLDACQTYFKQEQMDEMQNTPSTYRSYLSNLVPPNTAALPEPKLNYPPDNVNNLSLGSIVFDWDAVPTATYYLFELTTSNGNFNSPLVQEVLTANSYTSTSLTGNTSYQWRVKAINYGSVCNEFKAASFSMSSFTASLTIDNVFCNGSSDGSVFVDPSTNVISSYDWFSLDTATGTYNLYNSTTTDFIHNLAPNKYYVKVVEANGDFVVVTFDIDEPISLDVELSQNASAVISNITGGTPPYSVLWSDGSSSVNNNTPIEGVNTIYITDANNCFFSRSFNFSSEISAINDITTDISNLLVYPNPVRGDNLFMNFDSKEQSKVSLQLFSVDGKLVRDYDRTVVIGENTLTLPISKIGKGVYFIKFSINNSSITKKVIL
jgi:hypothetical protein